MTVYTANNNEKSTASSYHTPCTLPTTRRSELRAVITRPVHCQQQREVNCGQLSHALYTVNNNEKSIASSYHTLGTLPTTRSQLRAVITRPVHCQQQREVNCGQLSHALYTANNNEKSTASSYHTICALPTTRRNQLRSVITRFVHCQQGNRNSTRTVCDDDAVKRRLALTAGGRFVGRVAAVVVAVTHEAERHTPVVSALEFLRRARHWF